MIHKTCYKYNTINAKKKKKTFWSFFKFSFVKCFVLFQSACVCFFIAVVAFSAIKNMMDSSRKSEEKQKGTEDLLTFLVLVYNNL